jgi:thiol-disulfide isomerase/thioredoxin
MNPIQIIVIAFVGLILGGVIGFIFKATDDTQQIPATSSAPTTEQLDAIPAFNYPDLQNKMRHSQEWQAKIVVLNFWAAWCPPCREETPVFVELQEQYRHNNVKFVGIAIDDKQPVEEFVASYKVNYPVLMGDIQAVTLSRKLGNRFEGLPYTVVAAPGGQILLRHAGGITREQLEPVLQQAIENSKRTHQPVERI